MVAQKVSQNDTTAEFNNEFTRIAIGQIFQGILKRVANIDNIYGDLK